MADAPGGLVRQLGLPLLVSAKIQHRPSSLAPSPSLPSLAPESSMVTLTAQPHGKRETADVHLIASRGSFEKFLAENCATGAI